LRLRTYSQPKIKKLSLQNGAARCSSEAGSKDSASYTRAHGSDRFPTLHAPQRYSNSALGHAFRARAKQSHGKKLRGAAGNSSDSAPPQGRPSRTLLLSRRIPPLQYRYPFFLLEGSQEKENRYPDVSAGEVHRERFLEDSSDVAVRPVIATLPLRCPTSLCRY